MNTKMQRLSGLTVVLVVVVCGLFLCSAFFLGCEEPPVEDDDGAEEVEAQHSEKESGDVPEEAQESESAPDNQAAQESAPTSLSFNQQILAYLLDHEETVVIRSTLEWDDYKRRSLDPLYFEFRDGVVSVPEPNVNYAQEMLAAHSFGYIWRGGYNRVNVTNAQVEAGTIRVYVAIDSPDIPPSPFAPLTEPIPQGFAVRLPQSDLPVQVVPNYY